MSTILKALRRLEEEKTRDGAPRPLREEIASGPGERSRSRRGAPWMLFAALLLGAGFGASAWWFWPYERASEASQDVAAATPATRADPIGEPVPAEPRAAAPVAPFDPTEAVEQDVAAMTDEQMVEALRVESQNSAEEAFSSLVEVVQRPPAEPRIAPVEPKPAPAVASAPAPESRAAVARKRERARAAAQETAETQAMAAAETPPPQGARQVPAAAPPVARSQEPAPIGREDDRDWPVTSEWQEPSHEPEPSRDSLSTSARIVTSELPSAAGLHVKRTQWHPDHARRSAEIAIGGKQSSVHEGDVVGEYVVQEIKPSGVVLTRDGEHYERRVGAK